MLCYVMYVCMYLFDVLNKYIHTTTTLIFEQMAIIFFHFNILTYIHTYTEVFFVAVLRTYIHTHTYEYHREVRRAGER
jgi:hypothetical protein